MAEQINWDERAEEYAKDLTGPPSGGVNSWDYRHLVPAGAAWQREQLYSEAAVERLARHQDPQVWRLVDEGCTVTGMDGMVETSLKKARAVIAALLGEEE